MRDINSFYKIVISSFLLIVLSACCGGTSNSGGGGTSTAGSTAAMLPYKNVLYYLNGREGLYVFDIEDPSEPISVKTLYSVSDETVFIHDNHLYIGGVTGVDIFDITNPKDPVNVSFYQHIRGCDPFVADGNLGYVTVRNSGLCWGNNNQLEVLDISNPSQPERIHTYNMRSPWGLAKLPDHLAVCEDYAGLTLLEITPQTEQNNTLLIEEATRYSQIKCFDLIYNNDNLIATARDGIYQFNVSGSYLTERSKIPVLGIDYSASSTGSL